MSTSARPMTPEQQARFDEMEAIHAKMIRVRGGGNHYLQNEANVAYNEIENEYKGMINDYGVEFDRGSSWTNTLHDAGRAVVENVQSVSPISNGLESEEFRDATKLAAVVGGVGLAAPYLMGGGAGAGGGAGLGTAAGWGTAAAIGAPLLGGYLQNKAAGDAADTMSGAQDRATEAQLAMFDAGQAATAPWRETGAKAQSEYANLMGLGEEGAQQTSYDNFRNAPGYKFNMEEGQNALTGAAAATGNVGGQQMKDLVKYGSNMADRGFNTYANRLSGMSTVGANAATNSASQMQQLGNTQAQGFINQGNIAGQQSVDQANIYSNTLSQLTQGYGQYQGGQTTGSTGYTPPPPSGGSGYNPNALTYDSNQANPYAIS